MHHPAVSDAQIMGPNKTDAIRRKNGQQSSRTQGDPVKWSAIDPYRDQTPDDEWTISTISRRFKHGQAVTVGEPHCHVTCRHDRFPEAPAVTAEYDNHVFPVVAALEAWFEDEKTKR